MMTCLDQAAENSRVDTGVVEDATMGEDSEVMVSRIEGTTGGEVIDEQASGLLVEKKDAAMATIEEREEGVMTCLVRAAAENSSVDTGVVEEATMGEDSEIMMMMNG